MGSLFTVQVELLALPSPDPVDVDPSYNMSAPPPGYVAAGRPVHAGRDRHVAITLHDLAPLRLLGFAGEHAEKEIAREYGEEAMSMQLRRMQAGDCQVLDGGFAVFIQFALFVVAMLA